MARHTIRVSSSGSIRFIYNDKLASLTGAGDSRISRASHVEPKIVDGKTVWVADMSPCGGGKLEPKATRQEALDLEVAWLLQHRIPVPTPALT